MTERIKKLESTLLKLKGCINIDKKAIQRYEWELRALKAEQKLNQLLSHGVLLDDNFISLIDRLERACNIKYPDRQWNAEFKEEMIKQWKGKDDELLQRVKKLEKEIYYK